MNKNDAILQFRRFCNKCRSALLNNPTIPTFYIDNKTQEAVKILGGLDGLICKIMYKSIVRPSEIQ